jgi:uncharacterized SAM-binding protein YcdF (DUF218 family)
VPAEPSAAPRRRRLWGRALLALGLVVALVVPVVVAISVVVVGREDVRRVSDVIIVLGAAQDDGEPREVLAARLDHAVDLYRDGVAPRIMTVGGKAPGDRFTEAEAGRDYLVAAGVPRRDIAVVSSGRDTLGSLTTAARIMDDNGWCTAVLVSDPWHMLRSRTMARDLGMDAVTSPTTSGPTTRLRFAGRYIVRETAALIAYAGLERRDVEPVVVGCG